MVNGAYANLVPHSMVKTNVKLILILSNVLVNMYSHKEINTGVMINAILVLTCMMRRDLMVISVYVIKITSLTVFPHVTLINLLNLLVLTNMSINMDLPNGVIRIVQKIKECK